MRHLLLVLALPLAVVAQDKDRPLADQLPRIPPVAPGRAAATFRVQHGFQLELVASEPAVADPVDACFDANGRLYVAQMHGYPFSQEPTRLNPKGGGKADAGVIRLLEDTTGDGRFDRSVRFADGIRWPTSVCCYDGGVFVLAPPHIHYFKDTDGDLVADLRQIVFSGFARGNVQSLASNMKWGLDNQITLAGGRNGGQLVRNGQPVITLGRVDFSFDPRTLKITTLTGGSQFGSSFDDWGNRFVCSNSNHIQHVLLEHRYLSRHPGLSPPASIRTIAAGGAAAPVFRRSTAEPWRIVRTRRRVSDPKTKARLPRTEQFAVGFFTSATGVTIYTGNAYPAAFRGNAFIGDVGGNLVHRKTMEASGATFLARRADQKVEFITSSDNWFRPTNFVNGPDGTLYVLDMYRETIEHPYSIPEDIKRHLDLNSGDTRGRIYRLQPANWKPPTRPALQNASTSHLVALLDSDNGWHRQTAQRLLWERRDPAAIVPLSKLSREASTALGRVHALYALDGLETLPTSILVQSLNDRSPHVREHAIRIGESRLDAPDLARTLPGLIHDRSPRVLYQLAFSLGESKADWSLKLLQELALLHDSDAHLRLAVMTACRDRETRLLSSLLDSPHFSTRPSATAWLRDLARLAGASSRRGDAIAALTSILRDRHPPSLQAVLLQAVGGGLSRRGRNVQTILGQTTTPKALQSAAAAVFAQAVTTSKNTTFPAKKRQAAAAVLSFAHSDQAVPALTALLSPREPQALQRAAVSALSRHASATTSTRLLAGWRTFSPQVRSDVVDVMIQRPVGTAALLKAVEQKHVLVGEITPDKKQILVNHPKPELRDRARRALRGVASVDRAKVIRHYEPALATSGDVAAGAIVFKKLCAACHRVGTTGHKLGPDLVSVRNKSPQDLLVNILDPNREAQPNFMTYTLVTTQGRILTGMIATETASTVTLRRAEAKQDVVARETIETLVSNGKSLMPEGLEKELTPRQLADVIAWIKGLQPQKK